jgi:hypothetical protein
MRAFATSAAGHRESDWRIPDEHLPLLGEGPKGVSLLANVELRCVLGGPGVQLRLKALLLDG